MSEADITELDVSGMSCPLPIVRFAKAMRSLPKGSLIRITGDDPFFAQSMHEVCQENHCEIVETRSEGRRVMLLVRI